MGFDEERAKEGVQHLQNAAREMIEAARAFLDVAEDLVEDPAGAAALVAALADAARAAAGMDASSPDQGGPDTPAGPAPNGGRRRSGSSPRTPRVERIPVGDSPPGSSPA